MGVLGLWQLLNPVGQPVTLESLENKILAVDISIWLNQAIKGYRDAKGGAVTNAHLLSLFSRLCKLLFYKIRPIMIFDGGVPELKKQTVITRHQRRSALKQGSKDAALKLLANYVASRNIEKSRTKDTKSTISPSKASIRDDIYILPPLEKSLESNYEENNNESDFQCKSFLQDELNYLNEIDIESQDFDALPPDIKQEILSTLKENQKHKKSEYYDALPKESEEFSNYQMQGLLKRRRFQSKMEEIQKTVQKIHYLDIISLYTDDQNMVGGSSRVMSDECSHYVLLKKMTRETDSSSANVCGDTSSKQPDAVNKSETVSNDDIIEVIDMPSNTKQTQMVEPELPNDNYILETNSDEGNAFLDAGPSDESVSSNIRDSTYAANNNIIKLDEAQHSFEAAVEFSPKISKTMEKADKQATPDISKKDDNISCLNANDNVLKNNIVLNNSSDCESLTSIPEFDNDKYYDCLEMSNTTHEVPRSVPETYSIPIESSAPLVMSSELNSNVDAPGLPGKSKEQSNDRLLSEDLNKATASVPETTLTLSDELSEIQLAVQKELHESNLILQAQQAKNERQASTVLDHMIEDCKDMLRLFGVPYVVSPMEAEAQCAFFDHQGVTQGTITDDSDIWLFGGKRVYKNFFAQKKFVEFYNSSEILAHFGLTRFKLINFAMLTGSDYTEGIEGVGPVTAMEIISEFGTDGIDALYEFKTWWEELQKHASPPKNKVRAKLQQLPVPATFPNKIVFEAYVDPKIDDSTESFTWGLPDLDALRDYAHEKFGWKKSKVDDALLPVLKRLNERTAQTHLDSFFTIRLKKEKNLFPSKRVMSALKKIIPGEEEGDDPKPKVLKKNISTSGKDCSGDSKSKELKKSSKQKLSMKKKRKTSSMKHATGSVNKTKLKQVLQLSEDSSSDSN